MPLFFAPKLQVNSTKLAIQGQEYKHIVKSLRKEIGDKIKITNGRGALFTGEITSIDEAILNIKIISQKSIEKSKPRVSLAFSLLKKQNKLIIEKCTELGICEFFPFVSNRTVKKNYSEKLRSKLERVAIAAMKQSGSAYLPEVNPIIDFKDLFTFINQNYQSILAWENNKSHFLDVALSTTKTDVCLIIGPEGGFTTEEVNYSKKFSAKIISLGNNVLRAETAAIAASANSIFFLHNNNRKYS